MLGQGRKAITILIFGPPPFCARFSKFRKKQAEKGVPWNCEVMNERTEGFTQVRKVLKSSKREALGSPIHLLACFGQKCERTTLWP
jgi:hypothetical protein